MRTPAAILLSFVLSPAVDAASSSIVPADVRLEPLISGLSSPVAVRHAGDTRLFVVEQGGRIRVFKDGVLLPTPFLHIGSGGVAPPHGFSSAGERGLLGLAFAPDYPASGRLYVYYTDTNGDSVVARYQRHPLDPDLADPASAAVILRVDQDFSNHNGGDLHFGPDGLLYIGLGDGGSGNDPCNRAQTLQIASLQDNGSCAVDAAFSSSGGDPRSRGLLGKLLRIDVAQSGAGSERCGLPADSAGYAIPAGNPYAGADGICDEVWAAGLRNPYRFSFDRRSGDLLIADVGQSAREELDRIPAGVGGLNFGWRCREGDIATPGVDCPGALPTFTEPLLAYGRELGGSITGGFRYRGPQGGLVGSYLYGDFVSGRLFAAKPAAGDWRSRTWRDAGGNPSGFGEDAAGDVYVVHYAGSVSRIVTDTLFADGLESDD
jgi:glucose/arabinose dehydrogenase